jgi:hypothetical protein
MYSRVVDGKIIGTEGSVYHVQIYYDNDMSKVADDYKDEIFPNTSWRFIGANQKPNPKQAMTYTKAEYAFYN